MGTHSLTIVHTDPVPFSNARDEARRCADLRTTVELLVRVENAVLTSKAAFKGEFKADNPERHDLRATSIAELIIARDNIDMVLREMGR